MSETINLAQVSLSPTQLDTVRGHVQAGPYDEHYPLPSERLFSTNPEVEIDHANRRLVLPRNGAWEASGDTHPNRTQNYIDAEIPGRGGDRLSQTESARWAEAGYWIDDRGLPVTQAAVQMLEDPTIGVVTGLGPYWRRGINGTSDLAIVRRRGDGPWEALLVERTDGRGHALAGGYVDMGESGAHAAWREAREETGLLEIGTPADYRQLSAGLLIGSGATAHAMSGNEFYLAQGVDNDYLYDTEPRPQRGEVNSVGWHTLGRIGEMQDSGLIFRHHLGHLATLAEALQT